jgi:major membrane immunogen (membrane-anchored lipoprotein)
MPGYEHGKIYKIYNTCTDDIYIGSTTQMLCERMSKHRYNSKIDHLQNIRLYKCFHQHGIDNFYIELIESYNCSNKDELTAKEGQYIRELKPSLNKVVNGRTPKEYRQDNAEHYKKTGKDYRDKNKDNIKERDANYHKNNRSSRIEKQKVYYKENIDKINEKQKEQLECKVCGCMIIRSNMSRHNKTQRCINFSKNVSQPYNISYEYNNITLN